MGSWRGLLKMPSNRPNGSVRHRRKQACVAQSVIDPVTGRPCSGRSGNGRLLAADSVQGKLVYRKRRRSAAGKWERGRVAEASILSLNTVCPYYTMFPLGFPLGQLNTAQKDDWVLDPFCGRGTTIFAARLRGLGCVGIPQSSMLLTPSADARATPSR